MQIVSGRFRHRQLHTNPGLTTRPITARVKVSLFDRLQPLLENARVADVYSGTGTMGFEALSRGAKGVVFFEQDRQAFELLRKNVAELKVEDETICWRVDVTKCSFRPRGGEEFLPFDLVFFDPPYVHATRLVPGTMLYKALLRLAKPDVTAPDARLLFRVGQKTEFVMPPVWEFEELLKYSSMEIHIFKKAPPLNSTTGMEAESSNEEEEGDSPDDELT